MRVQVINCHLARQYLAMRLNAKVSVRKIKNHTAFLVIVRPNGKSKRTISVEITDYVTNVDHLLMRVLAEMKRQGFNVSSFPE